MKVQNSSSEVTETTDMFGEKVEMSYNFAMAEVIRNELDNCKLLMIILY